MAFLKQDDVNGSQKPKKKSKAAKTNETAVVTPDVGSNGVAEAIRHFAAIFSTYVNNELSGDNGQPLFTTPGGHPVKIAGDDDSDPITIVLEGDALDSIAASLKRIADALAAKTVGA